ncbi:MAG: hypothetical protein P4L55_05160 [Syntrophobacteraceae bacterium]|nr:hypothetical protein [Syntrophobacteraceae bacterium]
MKESLRKLPALLSLVLLAAHFLRMQDLILVALDLGLVPLLFWKKRWLIQAIRVYLVLGSLLWGNTLLMIIMERKVRGMPFAGAATILGSVAIFTLTGALLAAPGKSVPAERIVA